MNKTTDSFAVGPMNARQTIVLTGPKTPTASGLVCWVTSFGSEPANDDHAGRTLIDRADFANRFKALASNDNIARGNRE